VVDSVLKALKDLATFGAGELFYTKADIGEVLGLALDRAGDLVEALGAEEDDLLDGFSEGEEPGADGKGGEDGEYEGGESGGGHVSRGIQCVCLLAVFANDESIILEQDLRVCELDHIHHFFSKIT